jgi:hypothetical protein
MKLFILIVVTALALGNVVEADTALRGTHRSERQLGDDYDYAFLVSNVGYGKEWCLTADLGVHEGAQVGFKPCDFHNHKPVKQLWRLDDYGRLHSKLNPDRCMVANHGTHVVKGTRLRMADCDHVNSLGEFDHDGGTDFLRIKGEPKFCVTNSGSHPNPTDFMVTMECKNQGDFKFTYRLYNSDSSSKYSHHYSSDDTHKYSYDDDTTHKDSSDDTHLKHSSDDKDSHHYSYDDTRKYSSSSDKHSYHYRSSSGTHSKTHSSKSYSTKDYKVLKSASHAKFFPKYKNGCILVKDKNARNDQHLLLGSCDSAHGWKEDDNGLLRSELNYHKCMQADRRGPPKVGAMLRVFDCDKNNKLQLFEYKDGRLRLRGENLCAAFTGDIGNVNQDPIILKKCNDDTTRWTDYGY